MDSREALKHMIKMSGSPKTRLSVALGKSQGYLNTYVTMGKDPTVTTFARMAQACGYSLQIVGHGEVIEIAGDTTGE